jgi:hypothetical protein
MPYTIKIDNTLYADDQGTTIFTRAIALGLNETVDGELVQVCPKCHSSELIKYGLDRTVKEPQQKYICKDCRHTWREDHKPRGRRRILGDRPLTGAEMAKRHREKQKRLKEQNDKQLD